MRVVSLSLIAAVSLCLGACATVDQTKASNGAATYNIGCGGMDDWGFCYSKASELCGANGYEVLDKQGDPGPGTVFAIFSSRSLKVSCNQPYTPHS
jgi:hypothetical protein